MFFLASFDSMSSRWAQGVGKYNAWAYNSWQLIESARERDDCDAW